jgi:hypothetical protein
MWVISVFSGDRRKPLVDKASAASVRRASAYSLVLNTARHQSSAYRMSR